LRQGRSGKTGPEATAITDTTTNSKEEPAPARVETAAGRGGATTRMKLIAAAAAFLMFQGELFAGKRLLPEFGGAAYVWCSVILFFQLVLIVGYYGSRSLAAASARTRTWILAILGLSGLVTLMPRLPEAAWLPTELQPLAALLPFAGLSVALFSTTPLLHRRQSERTDYRIYAWSNAGALVGLMSYPFVVEPLTDLRVQNWVWAVGGLLIATVGLAGPTVAGAGDADEAKRGGTRWQWWVLPAVSSAILLATTNRLSYEASAGPLTWALPLAVFLGTYVWAFGARRKVPIGITATAGLAALAVSYLTAEHARWMLLMLLAAGGTAMLACNAWLAATRTENTHGFYKATAIGGAIGSAIVVMGVPRVTTWPIEFPILTLGTFVVAGLRRGHGLMKPVVAAAALAALGCTVYGTLQYRGQEIAMARTLYSCLRVQGSRNGRYRELINNDTIHGAEDADDPTSAMTYYGLDSGVAFLIREKQLANSSVKIGAVGLGTGTISWYLRPEDSITYYEIDAKVEELARKYFTYLERGQTRVVIGDARRSLEEESGQQFDILVLDAFSGDAIPTHLLTRQAGDIYRRHLKNNGAVAVHISNKYADLRPAAMGLAKSMGMSAEISSDTWAVWVTLRPGTFEPAGSVIQWTDERTSILPLLKWRAQENTQASAPEEASSTDETSEK